MDVTYLHGDHLGSASLTTSARYLPFGGTRWESGSTPTDFQFTGQRKEAGFGLYDYHARYYDPLIGRFVSADSIVPSAGKPQAFNRYSYVFNNPLKYVDPSGHDPNCDEDCIDHRNQLQQKFGIKLTGNWSKSDLEKLEDALQYFIDRTGGMGVFHETWGQAGVERSHLTAAQEGCGKNAIACASESSNSIRLLDDLFTNYKDYNFRSALAHELGHIWDFRMRGALSSGMADATKSRCGRTGCPDGSWILGPSGTQLPNSYARTNRKEDFAKAFELVVAPGDAGKEPYDFQRQLHYTKEQWIPRQNFVRLRIWQLAYHFVNRGPGYEY
jgi:RHS repeat-associated protein